MAGARHAEELMQAVVQELQSTFDLYLVEIQRLDPDGVLRIVASSGPLASEDERFLISEQSVEHRGQRPRGTHPRSRPDQRHPP